MKSKKERINNKLKNDIIINEQEKIKIIIQMIYLKLKKK